MTMVRLSVMYATSGTAVLPAVSAGCAVSTALAVSAPFATPAGRAGTADRSSPHAPQKRSPVSKGSAQLGHIGRAACRGSCDINYTHVRGR
ncbi:hypothetical protein SUDANB145_04797 [Streptomyces sp. enrichment culture]